MDYNEILRVLIAICPTLSLLVSVIGGIVALAKTIKSIKEESHKGLEAALEESKLQKKQLSKLVAKMDSIERVLMEERDKR